MRVSMTSLRVADNPYPYRLNPQSTSKRPPAPPKTVRRLLRQIHFREQGLEARVGAVGVKEG